MMGQFKFTSLPLLTGVCKGTRFVSEQLEEISTMETLLSILERSKENLLFADDYLARYPIVEEGAEGEAG